MTKRIYGRQDIKWDGLRLRLCTGRLLATVEDDAEWAGMYRVRIKGALCAALSDEGKQLVDDILGGLSQNKKFSAPVQFIFRVAADKPPERPRFEVIQGGAA